MRRAGSRRRPQRRISLREFLRRPVSQAAVRPLFVVFSPPHRDPFPRLEQIPEPAHPQALLPHPPVKTFHASVLHRTSRLNVHQLDLLLDAPRQKMPARQFRPVVAANRLRRPSFRHDPLQHPRHAPTCKTGVHFQRQALSCVRVHHAQHPDRSPAFHRVVHKVQRPFLIRRRASSQRLPLSHAVLALLAPDTQSCLSIHSVHSFVVHRFSAASQQNMQAPIPESRLLPRQLHQPPW